MFAGGTSWIRHGFPARRLGGLFFPLSNDFGRARQHLFPSPWRTSRRSGALMTQEPRFSGKNAAPSPAGSESRRTETPRKGRARHEKAFEQPCSPCPRAVGASRKEASSKRSQPCPTLGFQRLNVFCFDILDLGESVPSNGDACLGRGRLRAPLGPRSPRSPPLRSRAVRWDGCLAGSVFAKETLKLLAGSSKICSGS